MSKKDWQPWDRTFKSLAQTFSEDLTPWLNLAESFSIQGVSSPAPKLHERRADLMIELLEGDTKRRFIIECESRPLPLEDLQRRMALIHAAFTDEECKPEQIILNLRGGSQVEETLNLELKARVINLACMRAPQDVKNWPLGVVPFVGLMRRAKSEALVTGIERALTLGPSESKLLITAIYEFARLGQGEEFVMALQEKVRSKNLFLETLEKEREAGRQEGRAETQARLLESLQKERAEARKEGREEGREESLRSTLQGLLTRKYPQVKATTITRRLKPLDEAALRSLTLRVLDNLSWKQFWA